MSDSVLNFLQRLLHFMEYRLFYPLIALLPLRFSYKLATLKGLCIAYCCPQRLVLCEQGMNDSFLGTRDDNKHLAQVQFCMLAREKLDVYVINKMRSKGFEQYIQCSGIPFYLEAKKTGRPVILYTAHFGRLIMPAIALGALGYETSALMTPIQGTASEVWFLNKKLQVMHAAMQGTFVHTDESMRSLYKILSSGKTLIVLVDVPPVPEQAYYEVDFLGGVAKFPKGIVKLAHKVDALLVPYFAMESSEGLRAEFLPVIDIQGQQELESVEALLAPIERKIQQYPEQWWMWPWLSAFWRRGENHA